MVQDYTLERNDVGVGQLNPNISFATNPLKRKNNQRVEPRVLYARTQPA